jgi:hypothetical protein
MSTACPRGPLSVNVFPELLPMPFLLGLSSKDRACRIARIDLFGGSFGVAARTIETEITLSTLDFRASTLPWSTRPYDVALGITTSAKSLLATMLYTSNGAHVKKLGRSLLEYHADTTAHVVDACHVSV